VAHSIPTVLAASLGLLALPSLIGGEPDEIRVRLEPVPVAAGDYGPAPGIPVELPARAWYASAFHGVKLLDPHLRRIGVARSHHHSLLDVLGKPWRGREPVVHPADGQAEVWLGVSPGGEIPNPVQGTDYGRRCGFPVTVMLPVADQKKQVLRFELLDAGGRPVKGHLSSPGRVANASMPSNLGCVFFIPRKRLAGNTRFEARLTLEGRHRPIAWSFTTRGARAR